MASNFLAKASAWLLMVKACASLTLCPGDGYTLVNGWCFSLYKTRVDFDDFASASLCSGKFNGSLPASIHSATENAAVVDMLKYYCADAHIGLFTENHNGTKQLSWLDGSPMDFNMTAPDFDPQACANHITTAYLDHDDGLWHQNCGVDRAYICKSPFTNPCPAPFAFFYGSCYLPIMSQTASTAVTACQGYSGSSLYKFNTTPDVIVGLMAAIGAPSTATLGFWTGFNPVSVYSPQSTQPCMLQVVQPGGAVVQYQEACTASANILCILS